MHPRLGLLLIVVLLLAKVTGVVMRGPSPLVWDASYYWELGDLVANGDWLLTQRQIAFRTPGYPWVVGVVKTLSTEPLFALVCLQAAMWLATIGLTTVMAIQLSGDRRIAWLVLGASVCMVSSTTYVSAVLTETMFVFATMFHLWTVMRFTRRPSVPWAFLVGVSLAFAILTRPVAMLLWIADAIYLLVRWYWIPDPLAGPRCARRSKICVAFAAFVTVLCLCPWLARNHAMFGKVMVTEFVGRNVWIVTFQGGSGAGLDLPDSANVKEMQRQLGDDRWRELDTEQRWRGTWNVSKSLTASGLDDAATDRLMKAIAKDAISESPAAFGKKTLRRFVNFWRTRATELPVQVADMEPADNLAEIDFAGEPIWGVKVAPVDTAIRYRWSNWLTGNTILMLLTGSATMLLIWRRSSRAAGLWLGAVAIYFASVTAALEIPGYRYRMIVEPIVLLLISLAVHQGLLRKSPPLPSSQPNEPTDRIVSRDAVPQ